LQTSIAVLDLFLERPLHPTLSSIIAIHSKLVHAPYHQSEDGDPLRVLYGLPEAVSYAGCRGSRKSKDGEEKVVGAQAKGESETAFFAANVEGEWDGEYD
jgi:hypothetical protein